MNCIQISFTEYLRYCTHTHKHTLNGTFSGSIEVSRYQEGETDLDFTQARDSEWEWHQMSYICKFAPSYRQITMPAPHYSVFLQARCPFCCPTNRVKALKAYCRYCTDIKRYKSLQCFDAVGWAAGRASGL